MRPPDGIRAVTLTINIATRGRPELLLKTCEAMLANMALPDTRLMISADADDKPTSDALRNWIGMDFPRVFLSVSEREDTVAEKWNRAIEACPADVYVPAVDYRPITTPGFDKIILDAAALFPDNIGCVYLPMANASFPALQAVTAGLAAKLGYIYPPYFPFWFVDHWIDDIARLIDRISYADVASHDAWRPPATTGLRDVHFWATVYDAAQLVRRGQARAIVDSDEFQEPPWRKALLLRHHPLIEYRSLWINQLVREQAAAIEQSRGGAESEPDARYLRLKAKATTLLLGWMKDIEAEAASHQFKEDQNERSCR